MQPIVDDLKKLRSQLDVALKRIRINSLKHELDSLQEKARSPDFWHDTQSARDITQRIAKLSQRIERWQALDTELSELEELASTMDESLLVELKSGVEDFSERFQAVNHDLLFSGKYDDHDAILRLHSGAGGTDAQDWTAMLQRMYLRWADGNGLESEIIEEMPGEEAGIKSATIIINGSWAYGKLRSEHGVHRLVRLSPYNADNLRQTSFALVEVLPKIDTPDELKIDEKELKIDVYRSGGHGGQSVNTTDSAVRITHLPTNIVVSIQNERSQLQNKETAMKVLRSKLAQLQLEQHRERIDEIKGPTQSAEWGNQIRSYVLHPYNLVKDNRSGYETHDAQSVLYGEINEFINKYLEMPV